MSLEADTAGLVEVAPAHFEDAAHGDALEHLGALAADGVVFFGAGDNFDNMRTAALRLASEHPVYLVEWKDEQDFPVPRNQKFLVSNPEEDDALHTLLDSGAVSIGYVGLPPGMHERVLVEHLGRIGEGAMRHIVATKPVVPDVASLKRLDAAVVDAYARRRVTRPDLNDPIIYVHEHYIEKGAWRALREQLPAISDRLGRLRSFTVNIEESQIIEAEHRGLDAFGDGALGDFAPHAISLALNAKEAINQSERFTITDQSETEVRTFRYADTQLSDEVPTGFIVKGNAYVVDHHDGSRHGIDFTWRAGKGLGTEDQKYAALEFEHPDTGEISMVHVDLRHNTLLVPESIRDLFADTAFTENGYGPIVEQGLNGGHPMNSFQPWEQARVVTKWMSLLERDAAAESAYVYDRRHGFTLRDLEQAAFSQ